MDKEKRWTKREVRKEARRFAAAQLSSQDQPDWVEDAGIPPEQWEEFMSELQAIARRLRATIKD